MSVLIWICQPEWSTYQRIHTCFHISSLTMQRTSVTSLYDTPCMFSLSFFSFHWRTPLSPSRSCYCQPVGCNGRLRRNDKLLTSQRKKIQRGWFKLPNPSVVRTAQLTERRWAKSSMTATSRYKNLKASSLSLCSSWKPLSAYSPTSREAQKQVPEQRYVEGREWNVASQEE